MAARDQNGTKMTQRMMLFDDGCRERHEVLCDHRIVKPGGATRRAQITQTCRVSQFSGERQTCSEPRYCKLVPRRASVIGFRKLVPRNEWQRLFEPVFALSPAALICLSGMRIGIGNRFLRGHVGKSTTQLLVDRMHRCAIVLDDTA
jgi:hypothetical protein